MTRSTVIPRLAYQAMAAFRKAVTLSFFVVWHDVGEAEAGVVVDADMDELPTDATAVALSGPITGDAMADLVEAAEFLDIDVDHLAGSLSFVAAHRFGRLQVAPAV